MDNHCCDTGKVCYSTHSAASVMIPGLKHRSLKKHQYSIYKCTRCGNFHITTYTKKKRLTPKKIDKYPIKYERPSDPPQKGKFKKKKKR
jgi:hypothetical protein